MNILNLLAKEKRMAGVEISDSVVRIAFLRPRKKSREERKLDTNTPSAYQNELVLIEEPITPNIIENGIVTDPALLSKTLKDIWARADLDTNYAVVSIPDDAIYSRVFSFPRSVEGVRLTEARRLAIGIQLPMKTTELYLDWERTPGTKTTNEILLSTIPRNVVEDYVHALEEAGIKPLALESRLASIARAINTEKGKPLLVTEKSPDGITIFILKDGVLRFSRTLPTHFFPEDKRAEEIRKIKISYESEHSETLAVYEHKDLEVSDNYKQYPMPEPRAKWLIAVGALMRAEIPEGKDNLISLLPVGTEEAYSYQKMMTFVVLMRNVTIGVSVFFILAFLGAYLFMLSVLQNANRTVATLSSSAISTEVLAKEAWVLRVNALTQTAQTLIATTPLWSVVLTEVNARIIAGITISSFSAPSLTDKMSLVGIAKDRDTLNQFKKHLQDSPLFTEVEIPLTNLEQRGDIPFSASFRLKDPSALYYN
jgi:Tfp pilus assembly protein PilN